MLQVTVLFSVMAAASAVADLLPYHPLKTDEVDAESGTVGDRLWMWAHPAGFHDNYFSKWGRYPKGWRSRITPVEAAVRLDLHNIMFVYESTNYTHCERGTPDGASCFPSEVQQLQQYMMPFDSPFFKQVAYSVSGGGVGYPSGYTSAVIAALPNQSNTAGVLFDDFEYGRNSSMQSLQAMSKAVTPIGKDVFLCLYTHELLSMPETDLLAYLRYARRPMLWMANTAEIANLTSNWGLLTTVLDKLPAAERAQVKPMVGIYMFDYLTADAEMPPHLMEQQLATALSLLHSGAAHDIIFLGSPIVDMPIKMVERTRQWVQEHKDEPVGGR